MEKKKKIAQPATSIEPKTEQTSSPAPLVDAPALADQPTAAPQPQPQPKQLSNDERIAAIENELKGVDQNFKTIGEYLQKLIPLLTLADQVQARQAQQADQPAAKAPDIGGLGGILQLIGPLLGNAQQSDGGIGAELTKAVMQAGLDQMTMGTKLLGAISERVIVATGQRVGQQIADSANP